MFSHVMIGTDDIEGSERFYNSVLAVLGINEPVHNVNDTGQKRLFYVHNGSVFCVTEPINGEPACAANGSTIGFACDSPEQVKEFHSVPYQTALLALKLLQAYVIIRLAKSTCAISWISMVIKFVECTAATKENLSVLSGQDQARFIH